MVKAEDGDTTDEDEVMPSEQGASTAPAEPASFAELMARSANAKTGANTTPPIAILNRERKANEETAPRDHGPMAEDDYEDPEDEIFLPPSQIFILTRSTTSTSK
jgi:hypothetical protein